MKYVVSEGARLSLAAAEPAYVARRGELAGRGGGGQAADRLYPHDVVIADEPSADSRGQTRSCVDLAAT